MLQQNWKPWPTRHCSVVDGTDIEAEEWTEEGVSVYVTFTYRRLKAEIHIEVDEAVDERVKNGRRMVIAQVKFANPPRDSTVSSRANYANQRAESCSSNPAKRKRNAGLDNNVDRQQASNLSPFLVSHNSIRAQMMLCRCRWLNYESNEVWNDVEKCAGGDGEAILPPSPCVDVAPLFAGRSGLGAHSSGPPTLGSGRRAWSWRQLVFPAFVPVRQPPTEL